VEINRDYITIRNYLEGTLSPQESHDLEKRALDDPFLADAIEGYKLKSIPAENELSILQRRLEEHIALQQEKKSMLNFSWQRLSIAAAAGLMFITAGILFWMNHFQFDKKKSAEQTVEVMLSQPATNNNGQALSDRVSVYFLDASRRQPEPQVGWQSYGEYLESNVRIPAGNTADATVLVSFHINSSGKTEEFKIIKSFNKAADAEAIRLIKEGPLWTPAAAGKNPEVQISIKF
jgi:TonB family protein